MVHTAFLKLLRVMPSLKFSEISTAHILGGLGGMGMEHRPAERGVGGSFQLLTMDAKWFGLRLFYIIKYFI